MDVTDQLAAIRTLIDAQAAQLGLTPAEVLAELAAGPDGRPVSGTTLAQYFPTWAETLDLTAAGRKTYRNAAYPLAYGMALERRVIPPGKTDIRVVPMGDEHAARWLNAAQEVNRRFDLRLDIPRLAGCSRTPHGSVLLWPGLGHLELGAIGTSELTEAKQWVRLRAITNARTKRNPVRSDGMGAARSMLTAAGSLYRAAAADGLVRADYDPTRLVGRGRRSRPQGEFAHTVEHRRTLSQAELEEVRLCWCHAGDDPLLDAWLFEYHLRTGSRRGGALALTLDLVDVEQQLIYPPDKDSDASRGVRRDEEAMPVPLPLAAGLVDFARARGASRGDDLVFRYADGRPITARRYDTIKRRCATLDIVASMDRFGPHHLRSTAAAQIERLATDGRGTALKQRFLRHAPNGQTERYGRATLEELARAVVRWTRHPHPLAD